MGGSYNRGTPYIIPFNGIFHEINHPAIGVPLFKKPPYFQLPCLPEGTPLNTFPSGHAVCVFLGIPDTGEKANTGQEWLVCIKSVSKKQHGKMLCKYSNSQIDQPVFPGFRFGKEHLRSVLSSGNGMCWGLPHGEGVSGLPFKPTTYHHSLVLKVALCQSLTSIGCQSFPLHQGPM